MSVNIPYQCIQVCGSVLCAARGGLIHTFSLHDGSHCYTWRHPNVSPQGDEPVPSAQVGYGPSQTVSGAETASATPPAKRRKVETENGQDEPLTLKHHSNKSIKSSYQLSDWPMVTLMAATKDGRHLVAVTGHDKNIWVFSHDGNGILEQLSQRTMPKRPCSIIINPLGDLIISGDKFGDIYSVPLIEPEIKAAETLSAPAATNPAEQGTPYRNPTGHPQALIPAANALTVHTQRNMRALAHQQKHTALKKASEEPAAPSFQHSLLLGHVSMLTQVITGHDSDGRTYILSADRDEHIRVSRGPPHAHIIESFCQGHAEFVSRLSIPPAYPNLLISGGGDEDIFLWNWKKGELLARTTLLQYVRTVNPEVDKLAVTKITAVSPPSSDNHGCVTWIAISCEG